MGAPQIIAAVILVVVSGGYAARVTLTWRTRNRHLSDDQRTELIAQGIIGVTINVAWAALLWWGGFWS